MFSMLSPLINRVVYVSVQEAIVENEKEADKQCAHEPVQPLNDGTKPLRALDEPGFLFVHILVLADDSIIENIHYLPIIIYRKTINIYRKKKQ